MGARRGPVGISLGSIMRYFPIEPIQQGLREPGRQSTRRRLLPSDVMIYSIVAFGLFLSEGCREVLRRVVRRKRSPWMDQLEDVATESAISQARTRLGSRAAQRMYETLVRPLATRTTAGAWFGRWRVISIDGTTLDVADTPANARAFKRPGVSSGHAAYPQLRVVSLLENGTHILFGARISGCRTGEGKTARSVLRHLPADALQPSPPPNPAPGLDPTCGDGRVTLVEARGRKRLALSRERSSSGVPACVSDRSRDYLRQPAPRISANDRVCAWLLAVVQS